MRHVKREPFRFEPLELLTEFLQESGGNLRSPDVVEALALKVRTSLETALASPTLLHGKRTEAMFATIVSNLASVKLLKHEDSGDAYYTGDEQVQVPDYRAVLSDGSQILVEVKNFHEGDFKKPFPMSTQYVESLRRYAELVGTRLFFAIHWSQWGHWTLVSAEQLELCRAHDGRYELSFSNAHMKNEMSLLGDRLIAAPLPLQVRFGMACESVNEDGSQTLKVETVDTLARGTVLTKTEATLAHFFVFYGDLEESVDLQVDEEDRITASVFTYGPSTLDGPSTGNDFVGHLSTMLSREYSSKTVREGKVIATKLPMPKEKLMDLIPTDGGPNTGFPLAICTVLPSHSKRSKND